MAETPQSQPQQVDTPPYPGTTRIENGQAFDVSGKVLGSVDDNGQAIAATPPVTKSDAPVDYDALAKQAGSIGSAPISTKSANAPVDYDALAKQAGSIGSVSTAKDQDKPGDDTGFLHAIKRNAYGMTVGLYKAFTDPATDEEKRALAQSVQESLDRDAQNGYKYSPEQREKFLQMATNPSRATLAWHRLVDLPADQLVNKSTDEATAARELYQQGHKWKAVNQYLGATTDLALSGMPLMGPFINDTAQRAETGDITGAAGDLAFAIALEHAPGKAVDIIKGDKVLLREAQQTHARARALYDLRLHEADAATDAVTRANQELAKAKSAAGSGQATSDYVNQVQDRVNEAASNLRKAQDALKQAQDARGQAGFEEKRLNRRVNQKVSKQAAAEAEKTRKTFDTNRESLQKAVPAKGTDIFVPDKDGNYPKYEIIRSHLEAAKEAGLSVDTIADSRNAVEEQRQGIENRIEPKLAKYKDEPLTEDPSQSPKQIVQDKLAEMAKEDGSFEDAMKYLNDFNITEPTVEDAQGALTKLNDHMRSMKKAANNWDIYNMIQTNPKFAAYYFMADALRDGLYNKLESHGVEGIREARTETAALIDYRNAADAQIRRNAGATTVRGSGSTKLRNLVAKLTGKTIRTGAAAVGAEMAGPAGAVVGGVLGGEIAEPIQDYIAPGDMTRDEHIAKSMKSRGTLRKPVEIRGEGTPAQVPPYEPPPVPREVDKAPAALELTPRENTEFHADLAAHFGLSDLSEFEYKELEDRFRSEIKDKQDAGLELDSGEKNLLKQLHRLDAADGAIKAKALKDRAAATATKATEDNAKEVVAANKAAGKKGAEEIHDLNPILQAQGRGRDSAFVSHSPAMMAHSEPLEITGLPEGITSDAAHREEWAHVAIGSVDGLEPVEIRTDTHPKSGPGDAASTVYNASELYDAQGNVDPDALARLETQWLTMKMAGPASHEVFSNKTFDEIKSGPGNRADFRQARSIIREVHPDFSPAQIDEAVRAAYERARDFLTKPHIADRIRANAAVRENGLSPTLHASRGRITQFAEDIRKAHNEYTGNEPNPTGGPAGEGGEKAEKGTAERPTAEKEKVAGRERGGSRSSTQRADVESGKPGGGVGVSKISKTIPPERSTGVESIDAAIKKGGAIPGGLQKGDPEINLPDLALFHDPTSGSTLAYYADKITPERVTEQLEKSRAQYAAAEARKIGKTSIEKAYHPDLQKVVDQGSLQESIPFGPSFITPDGKFVKLSESHPEAIEHATGKQYNDAALSEQISKETSPKTTDNRVKFLNDTGAVRSRIRMTQGGDQLVLSVPKQGVTPEQIDAIKKSVGKVRDGSLVIERADVTPETKDRLSTQRDFPKAQHVDEMLHQIEAHPEKEPIGVTAIKKSVAEGADDYNRVAGRPEIEASVKPHNVEFAKRVADAFDQMKHEPDNPKVRASYEAMANEVRKQWDYATKQMGMKFEPWTKEGQPYANSKEMVNDVRNNRHLYFFQGGDIKPESPMAKVDPNTGLSYNDMFRAVHDLFGHAAHGFEFGPKGEENAYLVHRQMFPKEAIPALTSETRGQNSWVNFGQHLRDQAGNVAKKGEEGYVPPTDRPYAEQKVGLLPEEFHGDGKDWTTDVTQKPFGGVNPNNPNAPSKTYGFELIPEYRHTPSALSAEEARAYAERPEIKAALAAHPDIKLGWDTTTQGPELNVGVSTDDLGTAKKVAGKLNQRAIVNTKTGEEISAGGEGKRTSFPEYPLEDRLNDLGITNLNLEESSIKKSPAGSTVPLMQNPLEVKGTGKGGEVNTLDLTKALNEYSRKQNPALKPGSESKEMVDRAKKIADDEAKYQLAQAKTGTEWYTTEMKDHDAALQGVRPELAQPNNLTLFKAAESILSSGQKPYANVKSALRAWDLYKETGEFPRVNPATGKSWGPRQVNAYGSAFDSLNRLIDEKGEEGAVKWLMSEHPVKELRSYQQEGSSPVKGKADDLETGSLIFGPKRGPFMQNLHGIESKFTADMWVSRTWNRWMGTLDLDSRIEKGKMTFESDAPRNNTERALMKESFEKTAKKLGLSTSSLQAVLWYYEQGLYRAHGIPVESWSFKDAAKRVAEEENRPEEEQTTFPFGENAREMGGLTALAPQKAGRVHAFDLLKALRK